IPFVFGRYDSRTYVMPVSILVICQHFAAIDNIAAFILDFFKRMLHLFNGLFINEWPHKRVFIQWVPDINGLINFHQPLLKLIKYLLMDNQPACGGAALPAGAHRAKSDGPRSHLYIGIFGNNNGVITAQLQNGFTQSRSYCLCYLSAHTDGAGSRYKRNAIIFGHPFAYLASPGDKVKNAFRQVVAL